MKKIILTVLLVIVLLVVSVGAWGYFEFLYTKPLTKSEISELTPDWSVITHDNWSPWYTEPDGTQTWNPIASFNSWVETIPEQDKAWPILVQAYYEHQTLFDHDDLGVLKEETENWDELVELLKAGEDAGLVNQLLEALSRPAMGCKLYGSTDPYEHELMEQYGLEDQDWDPALSTDIDLYAALLPALGKHNRTSKLLISYAMIRVEERNIDNAIDIIETLMGSTHLSLEYSTLIGHLVELVIWTRARDFLIQTIHTHENLFTDEQLVRIDKIFTTHQQAVLVWESDVLDYHDLLRRLATSKGGVNYIQLKNTLQYLADAQAWSPAVNLPVTELKPSLQRPLYVYGKAYELMENQSQIPWAGSTHGGYEYVHNQAGSMNVILHLIAEIFMPSTSNAAAAAREYNQRSHASRLLIALFRHRLQFGVFPETIEEIDDGLFTFKPIDAFTGEMLKYKRIDEGPLVYSVGTDRDDDGGIPMRKYDMDALFSSNQMSGYWKNYVPGYAKKPHWLSQSRVDQINEIWPEKIDGDWVLYPTPNDDE